MNPIQNPGQKLLIIDLDDTIYETATMSDTPFSDCDEILQRYYEMNHHPYAFEDLIKDLWTQPIDKVILRYSLADWVVADFNDAIAKIDPEELEIAPFTDYPFLSSILYDKYLVTTGFTTLQRAKIQALGLQSDFEHIYIDDPMTSSRIYKSGIFKEIARTSGVIPENIWVIGDSPDSELKAGKELGMKTIQRKSIHRERSDLVDYHIESFEELAEIIS